MILTLKVIKNKNEIADIDTCAISGKACLPAIKKNQGIQIYLADKRRQTRIREMVA